MQRTKPPFRADEVGSLLRPQRIKDARARLEKELPLLQTLSDSPAARLYGLVTTYYLLISGWVVAGLALLGRWVLRVLAAHSYFGAYRALPWVALGWAMYGLWVVFLVIAGRASDLRRFARALGEANGKPASA